ncbi:MAG: c-type cytochrome [Thermaerobacterales bacterium]
MRSPQIKIIALITLWLTIILFQAAWMTEEFRLSHGEQRLQEEQIERGTRLYAENCVICHGAGGQGVVGPPLNRPEWREGTDIEIEATEDMLRRTLTRGRGGPTETTWTFQPDGTIESHTAMPAFGRENDGPFNEAQIEDLIVLLMQGSFGPVSRHIPDTINRVVQVDRDTGETARRAVEGRDLPEAVGVSQDVNDRGRDLIIERGCLSCHLFGDFGGWVGPNLTNVGEWTTSEFLDAWLSDPTAVENRLPSVWWGNNLRKEIIADTDGIHRTQMPRPIQDLGATEEELAILVEYLSGLRRDGR